MEIGGPSRPSLAGTELRRLFQLRRRIRDDVITLPRTGQRDVLLAIHRARQRRLGLTAPAPPQMTPAELRREIKWRVEAAGLVELEAAVRVLERVRRAAALRRHRSSRP